MTQETLRLEQLEVRPRVRDLKAAGCASDLKAQEAGGVFEDTQSRQGGAGEKDVLM